MRPVLLALALCAAALIGAAGFGTAQAQPVPPDTTQPDTTKSDTTQSDAPRGPYGAGFSVLLTNSGFGLGGFGRGRLGATTTLAVDVHLAAAKDAREATFFDRLGREGIPNKHTYLLLIPLRAGVQQRLFAEHIEDNFQPYLHLAAGPTFAWAYPYFDDANDNDELDEDETVYGTLEALGEGAWRTGVGGMVALGARFGDSPTALRSVRVGYAFSYLTEPVQLLEPSVRESQQFFGTPTITLTIGRLF